MYGIVNQAISGLVIKNYGEETWKKILIHSGVEHAEFDNQVVYDDKVTYDLAVSSSEILGVSVYEVLRLFGIYWVNSVGAVKYKSIFGLGGGELNKFLINLPNFHSRVMLIYPDITPPEFMIEQVLDNEYILHYYSLRDGLSGFMYGLLEGLIEFFKADASIQVLQTKGEAGADHDMFRVIIRG